MSGAPAPVDVAVGVLLRADGRFLVAQRPAGKPMAGYWEFPGGKVEAGETVRMALAREFREELGVVVTDAAPWASREFIYPHAHVRLHFWRIFDWTHEPRALEHQALRWERVDDPHVEPWLAGARPLKRWLALPDWYAISSAATLGVGRFLERLDARLATGLRMLQLREKGMDDATFAALFDAVRARTRAHRCRLLVNSVHPETFWQRADGVHLTEADLRRYGGRPATDWVAASVHDVESLALAEARGADFAMLGTVLPSASHPGAAHLGWDGFARIRSSATMPVYAVGGLDASQRHAARQCGAQGLAAVTASWAQ